MRVLRPPSTLLHLPFISWSSRFRRGTVRVVGTCSSGGAVCLEVAFRGGSTPEITSATINRVTVSPREAEELMRGLANPTVEALAVPDGDLWMRFGGGMEVLIPAGSVLEVTGAAVGPPDDLKLTEPLVVSIDDAWLRLSHNRLRFLSSLARVRISKAVLHPDGSVNLEGGARLGLNRAVRGGLVRASERLSTLVRSAPQFSMVRAFLA